MDGQDKQNPYKGMFDDLAPNAGNTKYPVDWSKFTLVQDAPPATPFDPFAEELATHKAQVALQSTQQNPFDQFDEPKTNLADIAVSGFAIALSILAAYLVYRLWRKVLSGHEGWGRVAKVITAGAVLFPIFISVTKFLSGNKYDAMDFIEVLMVTAPVCAAFWASLWAAKGFSLKNGD